jgi:hypothetical protein
MKLYYEKIFVINDIRIAVKRMRTFRERKNNEIRYADTRTESNQNTRQRDTQSR